LRPFTGTGKKLANPDPPAGGTAPNYTTEPLCVTLSMLRLGPPAMFNVFHLDKIDTALLPGHANARQTIALAPSPINICYSINILLSTWTQPSRDKRKLVLTEKTNRKYHDK